MTEEFELTYQEHKQAVDLSYKSNFRNGLVLATAITFLLCLFVYWYLFDIEGLSLLVFAALIGAFLGLLIKPMMDEKRYGSKVKSRLRTKISNSESGVSFKTDDMEISYSWKQVAKWKIGRDVILIFRDAKQYDVVPRRLAIADQIEEMLLRYKGKPT